MRLCMLVLLLSLVVVETTVSQTCSPICESGGSGVSTCSGDTIEDCTTSCGAGACKETSFLDSQVTCTKEEGSSSWSSGSPCIRAIFIQSTLELSNSDCISCSFWFSAITTDHELAAYSSNEPLFGFCSCCDDTSGEGHCPEDVPSCTAQEFCSDTVHFRTCKDWGNPACDNVDIPPVPPKMDTSNCSTGEDVVWCLDGDCKDADISNCTTICLDGSCEDSTFDSSVVGCHYSGCNNIAFNKSFIGLEDAYCNECSFWFSAVTTNHELASWSSDMPTFGFCSCCDDTSGEGHCPEGIPSCTAQDFCSDTMHFRTCKDWGNPACDDLDLPSAPAKTDASTCSTGEEVVWCRDEDCHDAEISDCTTICLDQACRDATFHSSVVGCHYSTSSCRDVSFNRSIVKLEDANCNDCSFWFSAVTTNHELASWLGDSMPVFGFCSCCDDTSGEGHCPEDVPSCSEDVSEFCKTTHLGLSCKDWGNPICQGIDIFGGENDVVVEDGTANLSTNNYTIAHDESFQHESAVCSVDGVVDLLSCGGTECGGLQGQVCRVECYDEACEGLQLQNSTVACLGKDTCTKSRFTHSEVDCKTSDCSKSDFFSSAVTCDSTGASCDYVLLSQCTCCRGEDCPGGDGIQCDNPDFCSLTSLGRTCKDWGNPICSDVEVPSLPPINPAETCNLGEDIYFCDEGGDNGCLGLEAQDCTVACHGKVCNRGKFDDSLVTCYDREVPGFFTVSPGESCVNARFSRSVVSCQNSCVGATFVDSYVNCAGPSCTGTSFQGCSCCDGDACPFGVPACQGNLQSICSRVVDGETCGCRGFPGCEGDEQSLSSCTTKPQKRQPLTKGAFDTTLTTTEAKKSPLQASKDNPVEEEEFVSSSESAESIKMRHGIGMYCLLAMCMVLI